MSRYARQDKRAPTLWRLGMNRAFSAPSRSDRDPAKVDRSLRRAMSRQRRRRIIVDHEKLAAAPAIVTSSKGLLDPPERVRDGLYNGLHRRTSEIPFIFHDRVGQNYLSR